MPTTTALVVPVDREEPIYYSTIESFPDMQRIVRGNFGIQPVWLAPPGEVDRSQLQVWFNDEGRVWNMRENLRASYWAGQILVGTCVFTGKAKGNGDTNDVPTYLADYINEHNDNILSLTNRVMGTTSKENTDED